MVGEFEFHLSTELRQLITPEQAWHYRIVPKEFSDKEGFLFFIDETKDDASVVDELEVLLGRSVALEKATFTQVQKWLSAHYRKNSGRSSAAVLGSEKNVDFLELLISEAKSLGSSDIHIESYEERCRVRFRIDGHLIERYLIDRKDFPSIVNKIKIKANLDIAEKRLPQDGRIFFENTSGKFDMRVSVLPTLHGEKVVLRLLSNDAGNIDIHYLGFEEKQLADYLDGVKRPHGIVLISGPTGSGKTTTLYATLKLLNQVKTNILTIEDPVEYTLEGINQVQVKENIGLTFAAALKSFLRQDPDVIMLGEIRDAETANMAIRASLTGHLVLSTIHTNSAWGTISRLVDMGVPSYLIASTINTTVAQRLARLLCEHCKQETEFNEKQYPGSFKAPRKLEKHFVAVGCDKCYHTGYKGRMAIYEVVPISRELAEKIKQQDFSVDNYLNKMGISSLQTNAFELFAAGKTSLDEVYPMLIQSI